MRRFANANALHRRPRRGSRRGNLLARVEGLFLARRPGLANRPDCAAGVVVDEVDRLGDVVVVEPLELDALDRGDSPAVISSVDLVPPGVRSTGRMVGNKNAVEARVRRVDCLLGFVVIEPCPLENRSCPLEEFLIEVEAARDSVFARCDPAVPGVEEVFDVVTICRTVGKCASPSPAVALEVERLDAQAIRRRAVSAERHSTRSSYRCLAVSRRSPSSTRTSAMPACGTSSSRSCMESFSPSVRAPVTASTLPNRDGARIENLRVEVSEARPLDALGIRRQLSAWS
jgi:hypothetical protein